MASIVRPAYSSAVAVFAVQPPARQSLRRESSCLVANERGVRLTMLRPQAEGGSGGGGAVGVGDAATDYALMT